MLNQIKIYAFRNNLYNSQVFTAWNLNHANNVLEYIEVGTPDIEEFLIKMNISSIN